MEWQPDQSTLDLIRHLALQNSYQYDGKGQAGSVISRIMGTRADLRQHGKHVAPLVAKEVAKANELAKSDGIDKIREILESEAPELLERKVQTRREGLPDLPNLEWKETSIKIRTQSKRTAIIWTFKRIGYQWPIRKGTRWRTYSKI